VDFSAQRQHDAAREEMTMLRRPRQNHSPALRAKVAVAAIKGEKTLIELAQENDFCAARSARRACCVSPR
jgi:hypothetical protein